MNFGRSGSPAIIWPMQTLRNAHTIARFLLVWFALSIGVAIASPVVKPQSLQMVCSAAGTLTLVATDSDGGTASNNHLLDCPLCAVTGALPPFEATALSQATPKLHSVPVFTARLAGFASAAPPPGRGPPSYL